MEKKCFQAGSPIPFVYLPKVNHFCHHLMFKTWILFISLVLLNWDWKLLEDRSGIGHRPDPVGQDFRVSEIMLDCCVVGSSWVLCCLSQAFLTNADKSRGRIYSRVLQDIQGNTARTRRWQRKWGSLEFGPEAINHRNSSYSLYLTWIYRFPCWPGASAVIILFFLWHFTFFVFLTLFGVPKIIFLCLEAMLQEARAAHIGEFTHCSSRPALQK